MYICGLNNILFLGEIKKEEKAWSSSEGPLGDDWILSYDLDPGRYRFTYNYKRVDFNSSEILQFFKKIAKISAQKIFYLSSLNGHTSTEPFQELLICLDLLMVKEKKGENVACGSEVANKILRDLLTYYQVFMDDPDFKQFPNSWLIKIYQRLIDVSQEASQNGMICFFNE